MIREFRATFARDDDWWIGWSEDVPGANAQERTLDEARESLKSAIADLLDLRHTDQLEDLKAFDGKVIEECIAVEVA